MGEREAVVVQVRPYSVHGVVHVEVVLGFEDHHAETAQLGAESVPAALAQGERVVVRSVMQTVVEITRRQDPPAVP